MHLAVINVCLYTKVRLIEPSRWLSQETRISWADPLLPGQNPIIYKLSTPKNCFHPHWRRRFPMDKLAMIIVSYTSDYI